MLIQIEGNTHVPEQLSVPLCAVHSGKTVGMRGVPNLRPEPGRNTVPPFWISPGDHRGCSINPGVYEAARLLWPWAYRHVEVVLHDAPSAAELLEEVALDVSARLQTEPEVGRNLKGYFITAFHHRVRLQFLRDHRIAYEGLLRELEAKYSPLASNWTKALETKMCVELLIALMPAQARRIVSYRLLGFTWEEVGIAISTPVPQARNKYYYGVKTAYERLLANASERRRKEE